MMDDVVAGFMAMAAMIAVDRWLMPFVV